MKRRNLLFLLLVICTGIQAQINYQVKIMSWNVLNWPSNSNTVTDTSNRCPAYRTVVNYVQPDVLVTMENTSTNSVPWFRDQVMNTGAYHYASGLFINGYDTDNALYYRDSLFDFISNVPIHTSLRDISEFTLVFKATGDTLRIYSCHLKASQGYEVQRGGEIADLRSVTNALPAGSNFLVAGDFNVYTSTEPAYTGLLQDNPNDDGNVLDVLSMTGTWNNSSYAQYHTQSTHVSSTGGFSGGGMNDRFDMILYSNGVANPGGVYYMPGTYQNIGNDGHHFNNNINSGGNTAVPAAVANALFQTSDHLPIIMSLMIGPNSGIEEQDAIVRSVDVFPNPVQPGSGIRFDLNSPSKVSYFLTDYLGRVLLQKPVESYGSGEHFIELEDLPVLEAGCYLLSVKFDNKLINRRIVVLR